MNANHEALRQEMQFRLNLLRLMTVPHQEATGKPQGEAGQMEEMTAVLIPKAA